MNVFNKIKDILSSKQSVHSHGAKIIARFPPSPTGWFHIGNARTALFNYFFVKQNGGELLFRLEDTDRERSHYEYAEDIIEGLKWLGIKINFDHPYKQSEHGATYKKYLKKLIAEGKAYISKETVMGQGQRAEVIRLKNPGKKITFIDMIRGDVTVDTAELGDFVIAKSLEEPIYHFAAVVDDFEMGVNHVIRGEDGIYNTPRQILIQEAIGAPRPVYAHMPFILNTDRSKLSKRKEGELVSLKYYRKQGYLPEAMVNFLAFCGWNPGGTEELLSMDELIEAFDITKVQKAGAIFNKEKLLWFNKEYIKKLPPETIIAEIKKRLPEKWQKNKMLVDVCHIIIDRISVWSDVEQMVKDGELNYFFAEPFENISKDIQRDMLIWKKGGTKEQAKENLSLVLEKIQVIKESKFKDELMKLAEEKGKGNVLWPLRVALSGKEKSPDPFTLLEVLGKDESMRRITSAIHAL
jgi:glutamyl-tRNA synthetase